MMPVIELTPTLFTARIRTACLVPLDNPVINAKLSVPPDVHEDQGPQVLKPVAL